MGKRIRLLAVIRHPVGGIRTYLKYTYGSLDRNRYHFTIVTVADTENRPLEDDLSGFKVQVLREQGSWRLAAMVWDVFLLCWHRKVDIIHSHGLTAAILAVIGNWPVGLPHIVTPHGALRREEFTGRIGRLTRWLLGWLLSQADVIHCVSEDLRLNLVEFLPALARQETKCVVIRNGVRISSMRENGFDYRSALRQELNIGDDTVIFGFLGRFMPEKGFAHLIEAIEELSYERAAQLNIRVLAVNDGAFVREYKAMIHKRELSQYFVFYGFTDNVERILRGLDAVVMPSLSEACPLVPMEAFVLGCPVVAAPCIGLREIVKDTPAVVLKKVGDSKGLASALSGVIRNRDILKAEAAAFALKARERFDVRKSADQLDALLLTVAQAKQRSV